MMRIRNKKAYSCFIIVFALSTAVAAQDDIKSVISPDVIFQTLALNRDLPTAAKPKYLSPTELVPSPDKTKLFVAEQTAKQIAVVSIPGNTVILTIKLPNEVTGVAVSNDGSRLYATCSSELWPEGYVYEIDASSGKILRSIKAGHSSRSPVLSPDGKTLYVCNQFNNDISVVNVAAGKETHRIKVVREPYVARITPDGEILAVANSLPAGKATDTVKFASEVSLIDLNDESKSVNLPLTLGSNSVFGLSISPDGKYAFFTHLVAQFKLPATMITGGWIHTNNLAIVDIANKKLLNDVSLDYSEELGAANPWSVDCTADGKFLCVAHAGSNQLSIIDLPQLLEKADTTISLDHSITLLNPTTIRNLIVVEGKTPRALAVIGYNVFTAGYFSDKIEIFPISLSTSASSGRISLGPNQALTDERMGEFNFYSADKDHCKGKWQSCSSCHPFTRTNAMNRILASGSNFSKNTKSMLYAWYTPPMTWNGIGRNTEEQIFWGIKQEMGLETDIKTINTIGEFFKRLRPMASPALVKGHLSESAKLGRELFCGDKLDCKKCHPTPLYTDLRRHNAIVSDNDATTTWDTPTLIESWRSGPWDHIGSTDKFIDLMTNPLHTTTPTLLNEDQIKDLNEYVLSL
jgi:YVTN family beta-propeller protein